MYESTSPNCNGKIVAGSSAYKGGCFPTDRSSRKVRFGKLLASLILLNAALYSYTLILTGFKIRAVV
jgi:hypothetical protein